MKWTAARLGWRNLGRNRRRMAIAVTAIALGQFTLVFINSLMAGFFVNMLETVTGPMVGHVQVHHPDWREERAADLYVEPLGEIRASIEALPQVEKVSPRIYSMALVASGEITDTPAEAEAGAIVGVDMAQERRRGGLFAHLPSAEIPGDGEVALGQTLATRLGVRAGQLFAVIGQDVDGFPVSELFRVRTIVNSGIDLVNTMGVVLSLENAAELLVMPDQAHEIIIHGRDFQEADSIRTAVEALLPDGAAAFTWRESAPEIVRVIDMKHWFDFMFLTIVFVAAAAGIANTAMMSTFERRHEFGMLLALGARPMRVVSMVLVESVLLGFLGVAIGSVLGAVVVLITSHTGINYAALGGGQADAMAYADINISLVVYPRFELRHFGYGLVAVTLTSVLTSLWPASLAARLEPMEAMRT